MIGATNWFNVKLSTKLSIMSMSIHILNIVEWIITYLFPNSYGWSYAHGDIVKPPLWPYVSDTGDFEPESCLFTFLLNLAAVFVAATMYLFYKWA